MGTEIKVGSTWYNIDNCEVNVGSAWKPVEAIEINQSGTWYTVWENFVYSLGGGSYSRISFTPDSGKVQWAIAAETTGAGGTTKGKVEKWRGDDGDTVVYTEHETWVTPSTGFGTLYVRLTDVGSYPASFSSHTINGTTWHALVEDTTTIYWYFVYGSTPARTCSIQVEIATDSGGTNIVATGTYNAQCSATT